MVLYCCGKVNRWPITYYIFSIFIFFILLFSIHSHFVRTPLLQKSDLIAVQHHQYSKNIGQNSTNNNTDDLHQQKEAINAQIDELDQQLLDYQHISVSIEELLQIEKQLIQQNKNILLQNSQLTRMQNDKAFSQFEYHIQIQSQEQDLLNIFVSYRL